MQEGGTHEVGRYLAARRALIADGDSYGRVTFGILAQLVEHLTFNQVVGGSNPPCLMH